MEKPSFQLNRASPHKSLCTGVAGRAFPEFQVAGRNPVIWVVIGLNAETDAPKRASLKVSGFIDLWIIRQ